MALVQQSRNELIEKVYSIISENSGKIKSTDLDRIIGDKTDVRFAITRLTVLGRISRKRELGSSGIEYFYHDVHSSSFEKYRRMELRAFTSWSAQS
jgi:hypothetical protein